jgi:chemotaxis protein CheD
VQDIDQYPKVFLQTGDCYLGVRPTLISTVLGSCVAVTMCDPIRAIGAICHAFLPASASFRHSDSDPQVCRFVDTALENMFSSLMKLKVAPENIVVKMFGGASGLVGGVERASFYDIGGRNVCAVRQWLLGHGLSISKSQTGGVHGRKLHFLTHTGDVWVKLLNRSGWDR